MSTVEDVVRSTVPVKPPVGLTDTVEVLDEPAAIVKVEGLAESEKSGP